MNEPKLSRIDTCALVAFSAAVILLIPLHWWIPGIVAWIVALALTLKSPSLDFRRRIGVLLGVILLLAIADINTDRSNANFLYISAFFAVAIAIPTIAFRWWGPNVIEWNLFPKTFRWRDLIYVAITVPLAWIVVKFYFFHANPDLALQWPMPEVFSREEKWRLVIGINAVGIWDELFFVNVVFATLRSVAPFRTANLVQAVVYTAVLYDMAFIGIGPILIYIFALTQGSMYESGKNLLWVLIVHLIIDAFLIIAILQYYYPDMPVTIH